jgi:hypothetical protein
LPDDGTRKRLHRGFDRVIEVAAKSDRAIAATARTPPLGSLSSFAFVAVGGLSLSCLALGLDFDAAVRLQAGDPPLEVFLIADKTCDYHRGGDAGAPAGGPVPWFIM